MNANEAWIAMFRRIPGNLHDCLALGMTTGAEIVVQKIVKLEPDFMMIRGRLAGTQDSGRVVLIPYSQLTFVALQTALKDSDVEAIFGKGAPVLVADLPSAAQTVEPEPNAEDDTLNDAPLGVNPPKRPEPASKAALLAKLRERLKN
ncbi:MAG: hypothetical protein HYX68_14530 [Planctomycetes bacterium]|jgi:hypothetical protein|nr:hypothetical protein [Planctomycetota bacterium]